MESWGRSWISSRSSWRTHSNPLGTGGRERPMYVGLPKEFKRHGGKTSGQSCITGTCSFIWNRTWNWSACTGCWMEPYIRMNTQFRKKAKNDFEKNFYRLMNNSVFGKTMENLRNRVDLKVLRSNEADKKENWLPVLCTQGMRYFPTTWSESTCTKASWFSTNLFTLEWRTQDNTKILMYDFFYNELRNQHGPNSELLYTDTDSLLEIKTDDVYKDIESKKKIICMIRATTRKSIRFIQTTAKRTCVNLKTNVPEPALQSVCECAF